ncbi:hypothetical protein AVV13_gp50 [Streptomyces phage SF1]|uniref:Uncharacterized protein n=2 Tax=Caudoviricetes TaxID=2731619 RepID=A0A0K1Y5C7_9CAUD|nr:hypothetical protein [Streptomyces sp. SPB78]YP_009199298.1 hypothetical protein AVV13_gp50 [Streptomyces phage SF1]YP_009213157.1 hypothetical protein AVV12_gp30 [Streptomyces phage SF3]AKY02199.1 hypothetical protein SF1_500 [Streptomyces phage SF1]ALF00161.1 hypothetical protein SF3_300 [Streptomyces phage SF3]EFL00564.1 predicted protein [Streptomyces sp. SPB78]
MPTRHAYRCEVVAEGLADNGREITLATYRAVTPRLAARWARSTARRYARLLSPGPAEPYLGGARVTDFGRGCPRPDDDLRAWSDSAERYDDILRALASGHPFQLVVTDYDARYALCVYPLPVRNPAPPPVPARSARSRPYAGAGRHRKPRRLLLDLCGVS